MMEADIQSQTCAGGGSAHKFLREWTRYRALQQLGGLRVNTAVVCSCVGWDWCFASLLNTGF
jgi:hypothetical protein